MSDDFFVLETIPVHVRPADVLTQLGYPDGAGQSSQVLDKVTAQLHQTRRLIEPRAAYLKLDPTGRKGFEPFATAEEMVLALATIGKAVQRRAKELIREDRGATGLIVDAIGTVAVEQVADFVEQEIRREAAGGGRKVSRRYAPGYCGWAIEAQRELFRHFPDTLGIQLTDACLMVPEKSLSFACLLSTSGRFTNVKLGDCTSCEQEDCPYRLKPRSGGTGNGG